jgi:putative zinc finger/helix-turn-helix YgiT family protein
MVEYELILKKFTFKVKGESTEVLSHQPICRYCGNEIDSEYFKTQAMKMAKKKYSEEHSLVVGEDIKRIRKKYGVNQDIMARILGIGKATLARYEMGDVVSRIVSDAIREMEKPHEFLRHLERAKDRLTRSEYNKIKRNIKELFEEDTKSPFEDFFERFTRQKIQFEKLYGIVALMLKKHGQDMEINSFSKILKLLMNEYRKVFNKNLVDTKNICLLVGLLEDSKIIDLIECENNLCVTLKDDLADLFLNKEEVKMVMSVLDSWGGSKE